MKIPFELHYIVIYMVHKKIVEYGNLSSIRVKVEWQRKQGTFIQGTNKVQTCKQGTNKGNLL